MTSRIKDSIKTKSNTKENEKSAGKGGQNAQRASIVNTKAVGLSTANNAVQELFEDELYYALFVARCHDTGEQN
jgi:hypothetical protein